MSQYQIMSQAHQRCSKAKNNGVKSENIVVPIIIDGNEIETTETASIDIPHNHKESLGVFTKQVKRD